MLDGSYNNKTKQGFRFRKMSNCEQLNNCLSFLRFFKPANYKNASTKTESKGCLNVKLSKAKMRLRLVFGVVKKKTLNVGVLKCQDM
jgi:hypothetical protein